MAYDIVVDENEPVDLATISGWKDFREWAESMDPSRYPALSRFASKGMSEEPDKLRMELLLARAQKRPDSDVSDIIDNLTQVIYQQRGAEVVYVTDGVTDEDVPDDWELSDEQGA